MIDNISNANTDANTPQIDVIGEKTAKNYTIIKALLDANITATETAKIMNYSREHISRLKSKLSKIQLVTPKRLKKAIQSIEYFADSKNYHKDERIKPSDTLNASKIFIDRQYPITQIIENKAVSINLDIDMSEYLLLQQKANNEQCIQKNTLSGNNESIINIIDTDKVKSL